MYEIVIVGTIPRLTPPASTAVSTFMQSLDTAVQDFLSPVLDSILSPLLQRNFHELRTLLYAYKI